MDNDLEKLELLVNELIKNVMSRNRYLQEELLTALADESVIVPLGFAMEAEQEALRLTGELNAYEKVKTVIENIKKDY